MNVTFIAHAGISIEEGGTCILIDPWFTSSTVKAPIIEGLLGYGTIDFQVPRGHAHVSQYESARAIFISHFHAHHAPKKDVLDLVTLRKPLDVFIGHPKLSPGDEEMLTRTIQGMNSNATHRGFDDAETYTIGPFTVEARTHTTPNHVAWYIKSATGSVLHIADPLANKDTGHNALDECWNSFQKYQPDLLFVNAGGNAMRGKKEGIPLIYEQLCLTPGQAAMLTQKLQPKVVSLIGCYNRSIWNSMSEYARPSYIIEDEFFWGMQWAAPSVRCVFARPGHRYAIREDAVQGIDTYIA